MAHFFLVFGGAVVASSKGSFFGVVLLLEPLFGVVLRLEPLGGVTFPLKFNSS